jgi:putative DNA primase/helicase
VDNYADVLAQLRAGGLLVDELRVTGRVVRRPVQGEGPEKRGWYVLHELARERGSVLVGSWGIWRGNDDGRQTITVERASLSDDERAALRDRMRADRRRTQAERAAESERAARRAESVWRKCLTAPADGEVPDYLRRKGIAAHGLRYTASGALVMPLHDGGGRIHALQFILSRAHHGQRIERAGTDKQNWPPGCALQGHYFLIGSPAGLCLVTEGYATGASLHAATGLPVAVALFAGNLAPVAKALRKRYPDSRLLICADDDYATRGNPGISAASAAALVGDAAWVVPRFSDPEQVDLRARVAALPDDLDHAAWRAAAADILRTSGRGKLTDFNDLHQLEGLSLVRAQIEARIAELGWRRSAAPTTATGGEGRRCDDWHFDVERLLAGYSLIYGTDTVFDGERHMIIGLGPLRSAAGKGLVRQWLEHPDRLTVTTDQVGFDPTGRDRTLRCNLWSGWPSAPAAGRCEGLLDLAQFLCSGEKEQGPALCDWLLKWLAYPLQHPGAKMATAVLMHGPEGTGKNTFFGAIRRIYGRYGCQFSQVELESNFNGWASGRLFAIGNEVVSRSELYHIQGRLKAMVTEPEWVINEKMLPARLEANHCNFAFFSNRVDIAKLDPGDRRYCVIWTPDALSPSFYRDVQAEIDAGGVAALHHHLLHMDLGEFGPHSKPPETTAKADLMELGMDSTERFLRDLLAGAIGGLPAVAARSDDLYAAYRAWASREGIGKPAQKQTLLTVVGKRAGIRKSQERYRVWASGAGVGVTEEKRMVLLLDPARQGPPDGTSRADWIGDRVSEFASALADWQQGIGNA